MRNFHPYAIKFPPIKGKDLTVFHNRCKSGRLRIPVSYRLLPNGEKEYVDGRHRLEWADENGIEWPEVEVKLKDEEVWDFMLDANRHRRHLTTKEKKGIILTSYAEKMSLRRIGEQIGVSKDTVNKVIKQSGVLKKTPEKVVGKDGKSYSAHPKVIPEIASAGLSPKMLAKLEEESKPRQRDFWAYLQESSGDASKAWHKLLNQREAGEEPTRSRVHAKIPKWKGMEKAIKEVEALPDTIADCYEGKEKNTDEYNECLRSLNDFRRAWDRWRARLTFAAGVA